MSFREERENNLAVTKNLILEIKECANHYQNTGLKPSVKTFQQLYTKVYDVLIKKENDAEDNNSPAELLYTEYVELLNDNLTKNFPFKEVERGSLDNLVRGHKVYITFYKILYKIFRYMNVFYATSHNLLLEPMCVNIFYRKVFKKFKNQLFKALC